MQYSFEFDEAKSRANKQKHGIVFVGLLSGRHWSAIATYRGETIRLISVRRSRPLEVEAYEGW